MIGNSGKETSPGSANAEAGGTAKKADQAQQRIHQPADEEIGDYADPDAIQVDGGDNSFIADLPEEADATKKKADTK